VKRNVYNCLLKEAREVAVADTDWKTVPRTSGRHTERSVTDNTDIELLNNNNNNPFNSPSSSITRVSQYQKNTHSLTQSLTPYLCSISFIDFSPFTAAVRGFVLIQLSGPTIFLTASRFFLWCTSRSYTLHFVILAFFHPVILSSVDTYPYHLDLFCCTVVII